jgi:hypothetical protein
MILDYFLEKPKGLHKVSTLKIMVLLAEYQSLTPVILATWETEIRRIAV